MQFLNPVLTVYINNTVTHTNKKKQVRIPHFNTHTAVGITGITFYGNITFIYAFFFTYAHLFGNTSRA